MIANHFYDTVRAFFDVVEEEDGEKIIPMLPLFLQTFIELANKIESEGIMSTIEAIVEKFSDQVTPYAIGVVTALVEQFWKIVNVEEEAAQNENEDIFAAETLAGHSVLRTVATVLDAISKSPEMYPEMENILFPLLDKFFSEDGLDIIEELLEITTYFTFYSPQISPRMWSLYPKMIQCIETWAGDYMSEFVPALDNFISRGTQTFIQSTNPSYLTLTNNALERCFQQERDGFGTDEETYLACAALIQVILEHCRGLVDHCIRKYTRVKWIDGIVTLFHEYIILLCLVFSMQSHTWHWSSEHWSLGTMSHSRILQLSKICWYAGRMHCTTIPCSH